MGYNYSYYYYHSSIPYYPKVSKEVLQGFIRAPILAAFGFLCGLLMKGSGTLMEPDTGSLQEPLKEPSRPQTPNPHLKP